MLKDLAKEYAALVPDWARPGMRCVDPETGNGYRHIGEGDFFDEQNTCNVGWRGDGEEPGCDRAIAAGPDLDDACTVGGLLLGLPESHVLEHTPNGSEWYFVIDHRVGDRFPRGANRAEAIIRACIAQAKGKQCSTPA